MNSDRYGRPADGPFDEAADITQEFWGDTRGWVPRRADRRADDTTRLPAIRLGSRSLRSRGRSAQRMERTRQHGIVRPGDAPPPQQPDAFDLDWPDDDWATDWTSDDWAAEHELDVHPYPRHDDGRRQRAHRARQHPVADERFDTYHEQDEPGHEVALTPNRQVMPLAERLGVGAVDPLLLRLGVLILLGVLVAPLALALRSGDGESIRTAPVPVVAAAYGANLAAPATAATPETAAPAASTAPAPAETAVVGGTVESADAAPTAESAAPTSSTPEAPVTSSTPSTAAPVAMADEDGTANADDSGGVAEPAVATAEAERVVPACPQKYEASPGDSWYRIAEAAGISPGELFAENGASAQTVILPGDSICLPAGAKMPDPLPPPTTAATATTAPATTTSVASAPPTTAPATTAPPTTVRLSRSEVEEIIRDVWPDDLEDKALDIAWRESKFQPGAYNGWCCYGLFQIHWGAHKGWLATLGIDSTSDLLDARRNTEVAYLIYQRAGGWGPWGG